MRKNVFAALKSHGINSAPMLSPGDGGPQRIMVYSCYHDTEGEVTLSMAHGKKLDHMGIQVKLFGRIDMVCSVNVFLLIFLLNSVVDFIHSFHLTGSQLTGGWSTRGEAPLRLCFTLQGTFTTRVTL